MSTGMGIITRFEELEVEVERLALQQWTADRMVYWLGIGLIIVGTMLVIHMMWGEHRTRKETNK